MNKQLTIDVLICSFNKGAVKLDVSVLPPCEGVRYIVSYQYTDDRYLELLPESIVKCYDVHLLNYRGQGLSENLNQSMALATADLVMFVDDDTRICKGAFDIIRRTFDDNESLDIAFFQASSYTGRLLKHYPTQTCDIIPPHIPYLVSTIEKVCRRKSVQGQLRYDERFGLGTQFLTCGEEDVWLHDASVANLQIRYFPTVIVETNMMLKQNMLYVDAGVQRSYGAYLFYIHPHTAFFHCLAFAFNTARKGMTHFFPMLRHMTEGIRYMRQSNS